MRLVLSSLIVMAGFLSGQAAAAPEQAPHADIRDSGFVYCVSGQVNTFNGTVAKLAMRQPFVLFKGLTFQKLC
ncbi:hypothetical protein, partial [Klebsiella pneumoniae]|uniref:hypothetical protein n=1 Tax=Klebsiella pneumoniae TaxID=573 RepID=UPI00211CFA39